MSHIESKVLSMFDGSQDGRTALEGDQHEAEYGDLCETHYDTVHEETSVEVIRQSQVVNDDARNADSSDEKVRRSERCDQVISGSV